MADGCKKKWRESGGDNDIFLHTTFQKTIIAQSLLTLYCLLDFDVAASKQWRSTECVIPATKEKCHKSNRCFVCFRFHGAKEENRGFTGDQKGRKTDEDSENHSE